MKYRIKTITYADGRIVYKSQYRNWWWPFWTTFDIRRTIEGATSDIERLKCTEIKEKITKVAHIKM